jgi:hypothetical protein
VICCSIRTNDRTLRVGSLCMVLAVAVVTSCCGGIATMTCTACGASSHGNDASSEGGGASCPTNEPQVGDSCNATDLVCWFGDSGRPDCRNIWTCSSGAWSTNRSGCASIPDGFCPTSEPDGSVQCTANSDPNARGDCVYPGSVLCDCPCAQTISGSGAPICGSSHFNCYGPPATQGCPSNAPNIGTPCPIQGVQCVYGNPCDVAGIAVMCRAGVWALGAVVCPT